MKFRQWGCAALALVFSAGCHAPEAVPVPPPVPPATIDFDTAAAQLAESELWRMNEMLAAGQRSGRVKLHDETLILTIFELTPDAAAREKAMVQYARGKLLAAGTEFLRRDERSETLRAQFKVGAADTVRVELLRPLYRTNQRARQNALLRLRRLLALTPEVELNAEALRSWPDAAFAPENGLTLADVQRQALRRAELAGFMGNFPDLAREAARIPSGNDFPLARFAALPAALAEQRAAAPDMDWRFAAAYAAWLGIRQEVAEAYQVWCNYGNMLDKAAVPAADVTDEFRRDELRLKRDLAAIRLSAALGDPAVPTTAELRPPTPAEQLAAAWVTEYLLESGE